MGSVRTLQRILLGTLIVALVVAAGAAIAVLVRGRLDGPGGRVLLGTLALGGFGLTALGAAVRLVRHRFVWLGWAGLGASVAGLAYTELLVWGVLPAEPFEALKPALSLAVASAAVAWASLVLLGHGRYRSAAAVATGTAVAVLGLGALAVAGVVADVDPPPAVLRGVGAVAVVAVLGTLVTPILVRALSLGDPASVGRGRHRPERPAGLTAAGVSGDLPGAAASPHRGEAPERD